jgi:cysteine-rich secretory family protein
MYGASLPPVSRSLRQYRGVLRVVVVLGLTAELMVPSPARAATASSSGGLAAAFVQRINAERSGAGRPTLVVDGALTSVAIGWSTHMADSGRLAHNPGLAGSVHNWQYLGENVGVGYSFASLADAFWSSAEHRSNILDRHYEWIGVGVVDVGGKLWVTEDFKGRTEPAPPRARPTPARPSATGVPVRRTPSHVIRPPRRPEPARYVLACIRHARARFALRHERHGELAWPSAMTVCSDARRTAAPASSSDTEQPG